MKRTRTHTIVLSIHFPYHIHMAVISLSGLFSIILTCSWAVVGYSQGSSPSLPCIQKLMPCEPYLKASGPPPATCCVPLKEMVEHDPKCLCQIFNNPALLKSFNITQEDGLALVKSCDPSADTSVCKTVSAPSPASPPTNSSGNSTKSAPSKKSAAITTPYSFFGGCLAVAAAILSTRIVPAF